MLRTRGEFLIHAVPNAAADNDVLGIGLIVATVQAVTAGGASLPGPISNVDAEWAWHTFVPFDAISLTAADPNARSVVVRIPLDSKAMRKLGTNQSYALIAELSTGTFANVEVIGGFRVLIGH